MRSGILKLPADMIRLGENLFTLKPILSCVNKLSRKSRYLFSSLVWDFSYGQIFLNPKLITFAYQDQKIGQHAKTNRSNLLFNKIVNNFIIKSARFWLIKTRVLLNSFYNSYKVKITNTLYLFWKDKRLRFGIIILLILAPASRYIYILFPENGFGEYLINNGLFKISNAIEGSNWYYQQIYWWVWSCAEIWAPLSSIFGIFLLFPKRYYPSYLTGIPFGYYMALLANRMTANSYDDFHNGMGSSVIIMYLIFGVVLFAISDKILFNTNHRKRAIEARIVGLINMPGMSWDQKENLLKKEAKKAVKENNEIFSKAS